MSNIIDYLKCSKCNTEYSNLYISFGENKKCFDFNWVCDKCNHENTEHIGSYFGINNCKKCSE